MHHSGKLPMPADLRECARKLRRNATDAESYLWRLLRNRQFGGVKFRRQHPLGPYVLDFYCPELRLCVELDGGGHAEPEQQREDRVRDCWLQARGIRVLHFWNTDVFGKTEAVLRVIWDVVCSRTESVDAETLADTW